MSKMKALSTFMLTVTTAAAFTLAGCGGTASTTPAPNGAGKPEEKKETVVRFSEVIRSIFYAPHYIAMEKGFFKEEGLKVDMVTSQGSDKGAAALLAGTADVSLIGPETAIYIQNQQGDKKLKVFYQLTMTDGCFLVARNPNPSFSWSALNGQSIVSWRPGSSPQMVMSHLLKKNQADKAELLTNIAAPAMVGAYESGKGEYIQVYEPVASMLEEMGKGHVVGSLGEAVGEYPETGYTATNDFIQKNPEVMQKWSNAVFKATKWLYEKPTDEVAAALVPYFDGTSKELIQKSIERYKKQNTWAKNPVLTQSQLDILQNILIENNVLKPDQKVKYEDVVDKTFAEKAAQSGK